MAFVENIDNTVIINVFSPLADNTAAGGAGGNFFGHGLIAFWTNFHRLRTSRTKTGQVESHTRSDQEVKKVEYLYSYQYIIVNPLKCVKPPFRLPMV